jgi:hypothetical protein
MSPRSLWLKPITLLLLAVMLMTGCTGARRYSFDDSKTPVVQVDRTDGLHGLDGHDGLKAHGRWGNAYAVVVILCCFVIIFTVVVDLIILPLTWGYYDRPFCCTEEMVVVIRD